MEYTKNIVKGKMVDNNTIVYRKQSYTLEDEVSLGILKLIFVYPFYLIYYFVKGVVGCIVGILKGLKQLLIALINLITKNRGE